LAEPAGRAYYFVFVTVVDCKYHGAWPVVEEVTGRISAGKCLVHAYVRELRFDYSRRAGERDFITEWSPFEKLRLLKSSHPEVSTCASCKWLPRDPSVSEKCASPLQSIRETLVQNQMDTVRLDIADDAFREELLGFFLAANVLPHVGVDNIDTTRLSLPYIGETDSLALASVAMT